MGSLFLFGEALGTRLFFYCAHTQQNPASNKQHTTQWSNSTEHTYAGETQHIQASTEEDDAQHKQERSILKCFRGDAIHHQTYGEERERVIELILYSCLKSIQSAGSFERGL
jgi:hypothetical protein